MKLLLFLIVIENLLTVIKSQWSHNEVSVCGKLWLQNTITIFPNHVATGCSWLKYISVIIYLQFSWLLQICDFGLAKWKKEAETQTKKGNRPGTVAYMAPERFTDPKVSRTVKYDVYSFGIFLWELLTEQKPFEDGKCAPIIHVPKFRSVR